MKVPRIGRIFFLRAFWLALSLAGTVNMAGAQNWSATKLRLKPDALSFGQVKVGVVKALYFKFTNRRTHAVTISRIRKRAPQFHFFGDRLPFTVAGGKSHMFGIAFRPTAKGHIDDTILLVGNQAIAKLQVHGTGTRTIAISESLRANPSSLAFGAVRTGSSKAEFVTITNHAGRNVRIAKIAVSGAEFSFTGLSAPVILTAGQSYTFKAIFSPRSPSKESGYLSVISNAPNSTLRVGLVGSGSSAGRLALGPVSLNFGSVAVGTTKNLAATLTASGSSVRISSATSNSPEFSLTGISFPLILSAGQHKSLMVRFTPQSSGAASGRISFHSTAEDSLASESLSGTGITRSQHHVKLVWRPSSSTGVAGYNVYRSGRSGGPYVRINSLVGSTTSYTDSSVQTGNSYYYVTTAVNKAGKESHYSNQVQVIIPGS
jgi:Abnormal spindle-like microcephaly-assoc'd, ASPM-SPD-2-Hydin